MYSTILTSQSEGVGVITLNRPESLNALNLLMRKELRLALEDMAVNENINVIVLTGAGRALSAGADINEQGSGFDAISGRERVRNLQPILKLMVNLEKPIIVAVNGIAAGAGFNLAIAGDMIIAVEEATFSQVYINTGLVPDFGGLYFLPRMIGLARAKELVFTGRTINAREAKDIGLVNQVVPRDQLEPIVMELAKTMAKRSATALALDKSILNRSLENDLPYILEMEAFAQGICFQSDEHKEALRKLLERKNKPNK